MDRALFLKSLRAQGYKGKATLADVKAWMEEQGLDSAEVVDAAGTKSKVEDVWAKTAPLTLTAPEAQDDADAGDETEVETKATEVDETKAAKERGKKQHKPDGRGAKALAAVAIHTSRDGFARKAYEFKIKQTENGVIPRAKGAVYASADLAEAAGAFWRSTCMGLKRYEYEQADDDKSILENMGVKAMSGVLNSAGGVFVPTEFLPETIWLTEGYGVARKLARRVTMSRDTLEIPRKTSIPTFASAAQNGALTASDLGTDLISLVAKKFYAYTLVSNELMVDSAINIADEIGRSFVEGQLKIEDQAYFLGDGTSTYGGISGLTAALPSGAYIDFNATNTWASITETELRDGLLSTVENVEGAMLAGVMSRQFFVQVLQRLSAAAGGRTEAEFNTNKMFGEQFGNADAMYKGMPIYFSQVLPTATATTGRMCYFGAFANASIIGDRQELRIASSDQVGFASDQMAFRATCRFDVNVHGDGRGTTYGPIVCGITG